MFSIPEHERPHEGECEYLQRGMCYVCCSYCNYDRHQCGGCGEELDHNMLQANGKKHNEHPPYCYE